MIPPEIYVIILNWNRCVDTQACLDSFALVQTPNLHILVVDNGSTDNSVATIRRKQYSRVNIVEAKRNLGFAGGMNLGIQKALSFGADYVLLLNNDTTVDTELFDELLKCDQPDIGVLAPVIYYYDHPEDIWSIGSNFNSILLEMKGNHGRGEAIPTHPFERECLSACALLVRREIFEKVGLFDERFFMYYEDMDFCMRVRQQGYRLIVVPQAKIWHKVSQSSGGTGSKAERYYMAVSSGLYFRKQMRPWQAFFIIPYRFLSALRWTGRLVRQRKWASLTAFWRGLYIGWFGPNESGEAYF